MRLNSKRSELARGFTLIELMIVVAIIGILSSIAIPAFEGFTMKVKRSERKVNLATIAREQITKFGTNWRFFGTTGCGLPVDCYNFVMGSNGKFTLATNLWANAREVDWRPEGPTYYAYDIWAISGGYGTCQTLQLSTLSDLDRDGSTSPWMYRRYDIMAGKDFDVSSSYCVMPNCEPRTGTSEF